MKASFITNFFLTTENGPQLGVRFYKRLGRTLCMILCQITTMEPKSVYSTKRKTIAEIIAEHKSKGPTSSPDASPRGSASARKGTAGESDALQQKDMQTFKHRFPRVELREPLLAGTLPMSLPITYALQVLLIEARSDGIEVFDCWFEKSLSRKGTFYISADALYMYSSVFGQKSRVRAQSSCFLFPFNSSDCFRTLCSCVTSSLWTELGLFLSSKLPRDMR